MEYQELKIGIKDHLNNAAEDFFMVGYFLRQISEKALFIKDGYKSIWEFAKGEYGLSTSSASRFMAINARFSIDGGEHMAEKYIGMGVSKLQEMLGLPDEELEKVTQETTVREIRAMKEPLSFFGLPKTVRPEGSLLTTPGCGDGKYDCFICFRSCSIRQEPRQCVVSTCGNPKPCDLIDNEKWQKRMGYSLYKDECQMLHHELAPIREGDKEPSPCCRNCTNKACFNRCDVAKAEDEEANKKAQAELRKQQQEAEAKKPEPTKLEIKKLYDYWIDDGQSIAAADLRQRYCNAGGNSGGLKDWQGSQRGVRINYKRELTWAQIAKAFKEIREQKKANGIKAEQPEEGAPEIIDADFREVIEEPEAATPMTDKEKQALLKEKEPDLIAAFYRSLYPGEKETIKQRKGAAITKMFKQEYGETYEGGRDENGLLWNCYPDKINLSISGLCFPLQITWGKFTTKLLALLEERPELETEPAAEELQETETEEKAAEARDEREEDEDLLCDDCANASTLTGNVDLCANCGPSGTNYKQLQPDPEQYSARDIKEVLKKHEADLKAYREVGEMPEKLMKKQRILVDALTLLLHETEQREIEAEGGSEDD